MNPQPTTGTSPEVLQHYLTAGIDIKTPDGVGKLIGLPMSFVSQRVMVDVLIPGWDSDVYGFVDCLPVLRPFNQLCDPLEDGTVPAVEVAKIQWPDRKPTKAVWHKLGELHIWESANPDSIEIGNYRDSRFVYLYESDLIHTNTFSWKAVEYLRRHHFAVGLEPHQYIAKQP